LRFNLSHSGPFGLVGWAWHREVGVDVEVWHPLRDQAALVRRYFAPGEIAAWERLPPPLQHAAFFNLWTRKEAYIKGLGRGLSLPLASFEVALEAGAGGCLLRPSSEAADAGPWTVASPDSGPNLSVAVALEAGACHIVAGT
jgi:4'-phosphopantetheinyl transferase